MSWFSGLGARLKLVMTPQSAERRMSEEFQFHIDMETDRLVRERGLSRDEARRKALVAFGGTEKYKEELRSGRGIDWLKGLSLDLKLGMRMLVKYPGLTIVGSLALSVAIGAGASYLEFLNDFIRPRLPFEDGDRVVGIYGSTPDGQAAYATMQDYLRWRANLKSIDDLGLIHGHERNLITDNGNSEPMRGVDITASALRVTRVSPLRGRLLTDDDEAPGAPPVVLLSYGAWQKNFEGDPSIVGKKIQLGTGRYEVVGIMPSRFNFPIAHNYWLPLRGDVIPDAARESDQPRVIGRLADGASLDQAQKELAALESSNPRLRPTIDLYVKSLWFSLPDGKLQLRIMYAVNIFFIALLAVCGANIATLVFARTATRAGEITVRSALGASRARVVAQLLIEAFVLAMLAAALGLAIAGFGARWIKSTLEHGGGTAIPFWWNDNLAPQTFFYAALLAVITAVVVGGIPALKATGKRLQPGLRQAAAGGSSLKFGRIWTGVIIAQVALTVILLLVVVTIGWNVRIDRIGPPALSFASERYLSAQVEMDREGKSTNPEQHKNDYSAAFNALGQRLASEPDVKGVTYTNVLPGKTGRGVAVELEGRTATRSSLWVSDVKVAPDFFDVFNATFVAGNGFDVADFAAGRHVVVVNESFVKKQLRGQNPVGKRIRQTASPDPSESQETGPWYTVVGVVRDPANSGESVWYRMAKPGDAYPAHTAVQFDDGAHVTALEKRIRNIAATVDPRLRLKSIMPMSKLGDADLLTLDFFYRVLAIVGSVALLLSTAGVYSLMSFSVARRKREIAIRAALGAAPPKLLAAIFSRAFWQLGTGVLIGLIPGTVLLMSFTPDEVAEGGRVAVGLSGSLAIAAFMMTVGLLACVGPARRALSIQPTDALRAES